MVPLTETDSDKTEPINKGAALVTTLFSDLWTFFGKPIANKIRLTAINMASTNRNDFFGTFIPLPYLP